MRRDRTQDESEVAGQDSFLDVVANIVGILILLVMVVGLRTAQKSREQAEPAPAVSPTVTAAQLESSYKQLVSRHARVEDLIGRANDARREALEADAVRQDLAGYVAAADEEVQQKKERLSENQRRDLELREQLYRAQTQLEQLTREQISLASYAPQVETVENLPTPLAKTVSGEEVHIRLAAGRAAVIPLDELLEEFKADAEANLWRLQSRDHATVTIGPLEGFRLRYRLLKSGYTTRSGAAGAIVQLDRWQLLPDASAAGEPVDVAIQPDSRLMQKVQRRRPHGTTVTIWTYPDSFAEFRELKRALYDRGYATAGRPLPEGKLIGGSPRGTKSAAQ